MGHSKQAVRDETKYNNECDDMSIEHITDDNYQLKHLGITVDFALVRSAKRRTVAIQMYRNKVIVRAPNRVSIRNVHDFVNTKADWIIKQRQKLAALPEPEELTYQTGELHYYLGQAYPLKIFVGGAHDIKLVREAIQIDAPRRLTAPQVKAKLERWYHANSQTIFPHYIAKWHKHPYFCEKPYPALFIRRMRGRWGSLSSVGHITLNSQLVRASLDCIDYVVLHEFCHLLHFNHSPAFYGLMEELMPHWRVHKRELKHLSHGMVLA